MTDIFLMLSGYYTVSTPLMLAVSGWFFSVACVVVLLVVAKERNDL